TVFRAVPGVRGRVAPPGDVGVRQPLDVVVEDVVVSHVREPVCRHHRQRGDGEQEDGYGENGASGAVSVGLHRDSFVARARSGPAATYGVSLRPAEPSAPGEALGVMVRARERVKPARMSGFLVGPAGFEPTTS